MKDTLVESQIFENIDFVENPQYEKVINDIISQQYSIVEDFFSKEEVHDQ